MPRVTCGIIPSRKEDIVGHVWADRCSAECILPFHPCSETHVVLRPDGQLFLWENDGDCDCGCQSDEDPHEACYTHAEITFDEFIDIVIEVVEKSWPSLSRSL